MFNKKCLLWLSIIVLLVGMTGIVSAVEYNEAPQLKEKVENGELPPVEERLPKNPKVVEVVDEIGKYGGTLNYTALEDSVPGYYPGYRNVDRLMWIDPYYDYETFLAEKFEASDDYKTFTIYLREGIHYSDGEPFTADDITFHWKHVYENEELTPGGIPSTFTDSEGEPPKYEQIDKYTIRFTFENSYPLFKKQFCYRSEYLPRSPKHYFKQFHPAFQDEETLNKMVEEEGFDAWYELFQNKTERPSTELPTLEPWVCTEGQDMGPYIYERNPYYALVDEEGNQLPYIDELFVQVVSDAETYKMRTLAGNNDLSFRHNDPEILPELKDAEQEGELKVYLTEQLVSNRASLMFNQTVKDEQLREVFQDKRFRIAVSHCIDRELIADMVFYGLVEPAQAAPPENDPLYYDEELRKAYIEYDPDKSRELLDEMGLDEKDDDGYRLLPNGERLSVVMMNQRASNPPAAMEIIKDNMEEVGIKTHMNYSEDGAWDEMETNDYELMITAVGAHGGDYILTGYPTQYGLPRPYPGTAYPAEWAGEWGKWIVSNGKQGEEPPQILKDVYKYWQNARISTDQEEREKWIQKILDFHKEYLYTIGTVSALPKITVTHKDLKNFPEDMIWGTSINNSYQFYFDN